MGRRRFLQGSGMAVTATAFGSTSLAKEDTNENTTGDTDSKT
ncbi:twin-arginine translocation signal domain-containing protein [Haladaptatus pallidirubidus]|nr:twin-arginine translocation signal domain-containing protein [Haladaptatus pallidirubidus]